MRAQRAAEGPHVESYVVKRSQYVSAKRHLGRWFVTLPCRHDLS